MVFQREHTLARTSFENLCWPGLRVRPPELLPGGAPAPPPGIPLSPTHTGLYPFSRSLVGLSLGKVSSILRKEPLTTQQACSTKAPSGFRCPGKLRKGLTPDTTRPGASRAVHSCVASLRGCVFPHRDGCPAGQQRPAVPGRLALREAPCKLFGCNFTR